MSEGGVEYRDARCDSVLAVAGARPGIAIPGTVCALSTFVWGASGSAWPSDSCLGRTGIIWVGTGCSGSLITVGWGQGDRTGVLSAIGPGMGALRCIGDVCRIK